MKQIFRNLTVSFVLLSALMACPLYGQESTSPADAWEFRIMPYIFLPEIDADATVNGLTGSADLSRSDVIDNLDFTTMGRVEAWKGKWGLTFDHLYLNLGADFKGNRGITKFDLDLDVRLGLFDFGLAYRLCEQEFGDNNEQKFTFEPYGGVRYGYLREKTNLNVAIGGIGGVGARLGGSEDWVEPFVGGRVIWDVNDKIAINVRGDAGGFGIGTASDLTWQVSLGVDYRLSENTTVNVGYKYVDMDYSRGSGSNEFGIDATAQGPVIGMNIVF